MDNRPIGVFDSGLGGLTVVRELLKQLPGESIVYFGDTARVPYGTRSRDIITKYSAQCIRFLLSKDIKMAVIACGTVSSNSIDELRQMFSLPILGVIRPGAKAAVKATRNGRIGVLGTAGTIRSEAFPRAIAEYNPDITVTGKACTLFVPIVEEGWSDTEVARLTAEMYLEDIKRSEADTVILGCTHYPILTDTISKVMGPGVALINPGESTAAETREILASAGMLRDPEQSPEISFFVSDFGDRFQAIGGHFLNMNIAAERIDIEKY